MHRQRTMAKADAKAKKQHLADLSVYSAFRARGETVFTGYEYLETETTVLGLIVDGGSVNRATAGQIAEVILAETSLYAGVRRPGGRRRHDRRRRVRARGARRADGPSRDS